MKSFKYIATIVGIILPTISCGSAPSPTKDVPKEFAAGQAYFHAVCSNCHGPDAMSPANFKAPRLIDEEYIESNFSDEDIRQTINKGTDKMPSQRGKFSMEQIEEIIKYLRYSQESANLFVNPNDEDDTSSEESEIL